MLHSMMIATAAVPYGSPPPAPPAPTPNSFSNGAVAVTAATSIDVVVNLNSINAGTNRLAYVSGVHQSNNAWSGAIFDPGGANETSGTEVGQIARSAGTALRGASYYIYLPDGPTGNQTFRITQTSTTGLVQVVVWNNVGAGGPYDSGTDEDTGTNNLSIPLTKVNADDLLLTFIGDDTNASQKTPLVGSVRANLGTNDASGISASTADDIAAATGSVNGGWNSDGGGVVDLVGIAALFPRMT